MCVMVKEQSWKVKAGLTVEAALVCPFLCLIICGMLIVTRGLYQTAEEYAKEQMIRQKQGMSSGMLIRLEAITEELL